MKNFEFFELKGGEGEGIDGDRLSITSRLVCSMVVDGPPSL